MLNNLSKKTTLSHVCCSEPIAAISDPPTGKYDRDCSGQRPPEWKHDVREHSEDGEYDPEDFAFHRIILFWRAD